MLDISLKDILRNSHYGEWLPRNSYLRQLSESKKKIKKYVK